MLTKRELYILSITCNENIDYCPECECESGEIMGSERVCKKCGLVLQGNPPPSYVDKCIYPYGFLF